MQVHLSETGANAGRRLCGAPRADDNRSVHAIYAPLQNPTFLASVCHECLKIWAAEAYDEGDEIPQYLVPFRHAPVATASNEAPIGYAASAHFAHSTAT